MDIFISILLLFAGALLAAFCSSQLLMSILCAIPMHCKLHKQNAINFKSAMLASTATILLHLIIIAVVSVLVAIFASALSQRLFFGAFGVVTILVLFRSGKTKSNLQNYFKSFRSFIDIHALDMSVFDDIA